MTWCGGTLIGIEADWLGNDVLEKSAPVQGSSNWSCPPPSWLVIFILLCLLSTSAFLEQNNEKNHFESQELGFGFQNYLSGHEKTSIHPL